MVLDDDREIKTNKLNNYKIKNWLLLIIFLFATDELNNSLDIKEYL